MATARKIAISTKYIVKITKWHVNQGQDVGKDCILASYVYCNDENGSTTYITERKLKSKFDGQVFKILVGPGVEVPLGAPVISIVEEQCKHTIVMKEMCCECGADLRKAAGIPGELVEPYQAEVSMVHNIPELRVSVEEATQIAKYDEKQLLKARKLALVVDLDQTLIHTTHEHITGNHKDIFHFHLPDQPFEYHTKVRPGAKQFLETVSTMYELHIFTMGSRLYAHTIARHLDPDEKLFAHRIRSRDECLDGFCKSQDLRALFPCGDHMVCIIDDREDVWNFAPNLITVKPYRYFVGTGDINDPFLKKQLLGVQEESKSNSSSPKDQPVEISSDYDEKSTEEKAGTTVKDTTARTDLTVEAPSTFKDSIAKGVDDDADDHENQEQNPRTESDADHSHDLDDYLFYLEEILERVHRSFFSVLDEIKAKGGLTKQDPSVTRFCTAGTINPDTRAIIPALRQQTLKGANIVFTGLIPTNVPFEKSAPYRAALGLGAKVTSNLIIKKANQNNVKCEDYSTHVIAARLGTEKAYRAARTRHIKLVNPDWLWCCAQRWEWVEERLFPVTNEDSLNGISTPEVCSKDVTVLDKAYSDKSSNPIKRNNGMSPLAKGTGKGNITRSALYGALGDIDSTTFSKNELEEMDKEVEEYMLSDKDDDGDCVGSISGSSSRQSGRSSTDSSLSTSSQGSRASNPQGNKRKKDDNSDFLESNATAKKFRNMNQGVPLSNEMMGNGRDSNNSHADDDNSSDDDESDSEDDLQIGALLERQISDAPYP